MFIPENVNVSGGNLIITSQMQQYQVGNNTVNFTSESSANHEPNATSGSSRKLHADSNLAAPLEFELRQVHGAGRQTVIESLGGCKGYPGRSLQRSPPRRAHYIAILLFQRTVNRPTYARSCRRMDRHP